jgi:hypothetical protein
MLIVKKTDYRAGIGVDYTHGLIVFLRPGARIQKGQEI